MTESTSALLLAAVSIGLIHTAIGPDHYLPFIVMSKARGWSIRKTSLITILCGIGHVLSSVVLGFVGIAAGIAVGKLELFESYRGNLAAWALIAFGLVYMVWGIRRALKKKPHGHPHPHAHSKSKDLTPWILFTVFVFGPCEPLIPLLMYPAAQHDITAVILVATAFGVTTIATMLTIVVAATLGLKPLKLERLAPYGHSMAGGAILASGLAIQLLGL